MTLSDQKHGRTCLLLGSGFILVILSACACLAGSLDSVRCYVWDFALRSGQRNELTRQITGEFEEKLTQKKICKVLERRNYARLISNKDNERAVLRLEGISSVTRDTLKANSANAVVFGEVYFDTADGSYKVTATLENFDGTKNVWSTKIRKSVIDDASTREKAMGDLVDRIADDSQSAERENNRKTFYLQISRSLNEYILRAENLKDAFRYLPDLVYGNKKIADDLTRAVSQYNQIADSLKINSDVFVEAVSANWQKPEAADNLRQLLRYAMLDIHETEIRVFNDMLAKIIAILNGTMTDKSEVEATKMSIRTSVPGRVETLGAKLIQFERNELDVLDMLKP